MSQIEVLDKGYIRLVDSMGTDLSVVNGAKVSYAKEAEGYGSKEDRLLNFLIRENHTSPLRQCALTFEVYAPMMVARQWWKHHVASTYVDDQNGYNESSRRYITEDSEFYIPGPGDWRSKPENSKQGSGDNLRIDLGGIWSAKLEQHVNACEDRYQEAIEAGIAPEQARLFLPAYGLYIRFRWTVSLHGAMNFLSLRLPKDAQKEIQDYARAVEQLTAEKFPNTVRIWNEYR